MSEISWVGEEVSIEEALAHLNLSKSQIKKCGLTKKQRLKRIKKHSILEIPKALFNRFEAYPVFGDSERRPVVIAKEDEFLAVSKPSYVHSHPLSYFEKDNIISFLKEESYFSFLSPFKEATFDRGLLYRLDYETSGLTLFTNSTDFLSKVRSKCITPELKLYQAVVEGDYDGEPFLTNRLTRAGKKVYADEQGTEAQVGVKKVAYNSELGLSLLEVSLQEGLRHQIRAQLSIAGFPIMGDILYGARPSENGFGLHCYEYRIKSKKFNDNSFSSLKLFSL